MTDTEFSERHLDRAAGESFWPAEKLSYDDLCADVKARLIDTVVVATVDVHGKLVGKRVPADLFLARLRDGIELASAILIYDNDWSFLEGFPEIGAQNAWSDMETVPDLTTLRRYAHLDRTAIVLADCLWPDHSPVEYSPRRILRRQLERCEARGLMPVCAAETEFFVFAESYESAQEKNWCALDRLHQFPPDYSVLRSDLDEPILGAIRRQAIASGIPIETAKQELGKGQVELALTYCEALEAADRITLFKNLTKTIADQMGVSASFMARIDHRESGSSGHLHQSVWDLQGERNLMAEADDPKRLSDLGRWWIGGQMAVAQELMPLFCPNVNSYKRLTADNFAPTTIAWGLDVRTAAFRLVGSGKSMNFENRIPGADANFYLVIAGMIAAGLHGVENQIEPPDPPLLSAERTGGERLPLSLPAALERFRSSEFARAALGEKVVDHLCVAADHELAVYAKEVSDIEKRRFFQWA